MSNLRNGKGCNKRDRDHGWEIRFFLITLKRWQMVQILIVSRLQGWKNRVRCVNKFKFTEPDTVRVENPTCLQIQNPIVPHMKVRVTHKEALNNPGI
jgi:hypothetical protein